MKLKAFIKECSSIHAPLGHLAQDMLDDDEFPINGTYKEINDYMESMEMCDGAERAWIKFKKLYKTKL